MAKRDYYEVLGVDKSATGPEIKKAYRRVAMKHHPDRNEGDKASEEKFKEASEAYEVLSDGDKKAAYDRFGHEGLEQQMGGGGHSGGFSDIFGDVFGDIFGGGGGGGRSRGPRRGADLRYELAVDLEEAVHGTSTKIKIPTQVACEPCNGSGAKPGSKPLACGTCGGNGRVRMQQGFFAVEQTCPNCKGKGTLISDPCGSCRGQGRVEKRKTLSVKVPAGVDTGDRIRLTGEGQAGPDGGPQGDLFVEIHVREHAIFERDGKHLYCEVPIDFAEAVLGGDLEVPTLDGRVKLKIPSETQTGKMFRLGGKGVKPVRGGAVGDLMCKVVVETPVGLSREQKDLLRDFQASIKSGGDKHSPRRSGWFDGVRQFFDDMKS